MINSTPDTTQVQKKNILVVNDDGEFCGTLERLFSKHFNIIITNSIRAASAKISEGFKPGLIISSHKLPDGSGADFLAESSKSNPDSIRIIITEHSSMKEIIPYINQAHAFMYLTKPVEEVNLIQAVRIGFEQYSNQLRIQQLKFRIAMTEKSAEQARPSAAASSEIKGILNFVSTAAGLHSFNERLYYTNHLSCVISIVRALAQELQLNESRVLDAEIGCLLLQFVFSGMPIKFMLQDPYDMTNEDERVSYLTFFGNAVEACARNSLFSKYSDFLKQLWEHADGSGFPNGLKGEKIFSISQLIAISNIYHNKAFRITPAGFKVLIKKGILVTELEELRSRQSEAVKFLFRKANWFDYDVFHAFQDIVKKKELKELLPPAEANPILWFDNWLLANGETSTGETADSVKDSEVRTGIASELTDEKKQGSNFIDLEIPVVKLSPGMILSANLSTKKGMMVIRNNTVITANDVEYIQQLSKTSMIEENINIAIPVSQK